jgi:protein-tyrosine phosphatase
MDKVFWLIPGRLAGRPGPDRAPWNPRSFREAGIGAVLSVNDGSLCHPKDFAALDITYACVPLPDNAPPRPGDERICLAALPRAYEFARAQMQKGQSVLVHCSSGKDRTGLFLCYFLMREHGLSCGQALDAVREVRPIALSASGWEPFAIDVLGRLQELDGTT